MGLPPQFNGKVLCKHCRYYKDGECHKLPKQPRGQNWVYPQVNPEQDYCDYFKAGEGKR